jgi:hypothetical protein
MTHFSAADGNLTAYLDGLASPWSSIPPLSNAAIKDSLGVRKPDQEAGKESWN